MQDDHNKNKSFQAEPSPADVVLTAQSTSRVKKKTQDEEFTPAWIKIFGGSILSILFLSVITVTGYIISNLNNLQTQVTNLNSEMVSKKEFNERQKNMWDAVSEQNKANGDGVVNCKERLNSLESQAKERQTWMEKVELRIQAQEKAVETANKDIVAHKERLTILEQQLNTLRTDHTALQKEVQGLRERILTLENRKKE
jgi:polyhydroxyalkanoate synthesis regulator phasin